MSDVVHPVVFLFDVDNTLLDNDRIAADLKRYLTREVGAERQERYWTLFEQLRGELGYADYLGALQRYRLENPRDPHLLAVSSFLVNYPFANRLYPESLDVLEHAGASAPTVILSDGDVVFQPLKVERSGLFDACGDVRSTCSTTAIHSWAGKMPWFRAT
jgi:FMN phosphatase YigB (HAD superfamily)